jgi:hypothetical protein
MRGVVTFTRAQFLQGKDGAGDAMGYQGRVVMSNRPVGGLGAGLMDLFGNVEQLFVRGPSLRA